MYNSRIFEFAVLLHPSEEQKKTGTKARIIVPPTFIVARDQNEATMMASRAISDEFVNQLDRCEVAVRPF